MQRRGSSTRSTTSRTLGGIALLLTLGVSACTGGSDEPAPAPASSTSTLPPAITTPVPPPTPGTAESTVPSQKVTRRKPVDLAAEGQAADGVRVQLTKIEAIQAMARGAGEVAGPALAVTVQIDNSTGRAVSLASAVVNLTAADGSPGGSMSGEPAVLLPQAVEPRSTVSGVYVFTVPQGKRNPVTIDVTVTPNDPVVVFRGRPTS